MAYPFDPPSPHNELKGIKRASSVLVRGFSAMEIAKQSGLVPNHYTEAQFIEWLRGPRGFSTFELWTQLPGNSGKNENDYFIWLGFAEAIAADAIMAAITAAAAATAADRVAVAADKTAAAGSATAADTSADAAAGSATAAEAARAAAEAFAVNPASVTEVLAMTNQTKFIHPKNMADVAKFVPIDASERAVNVVTWDLHLGIHRRMTLDANITQGNPLNPKDGQTYQFKYKQDATGGRTVALAPKMTIGDNSIVPNTGANKVNILNAVYAEDDDLYYCNWFRAA